MKSKCKTPKKIKEPKIKQAPSLAKKIASGLTPGKAKRRGKV